MKNITVDGTPLTTHLSREKAKEVKEHVRSKVVEQSAEARCRSNCSRSYRAIVNRPLWDKKQKNSKVIIYTKKELSDYVKNNTFIATKGYTMLLTIEIEGEELVVGGHYSKARRGARERSTGLALEPDEQSEFEISTIIFPPGTELTEGPELWDAIEKEAIAIIEEPADDYL